MNVALCCLQDIWPIWMEVCPMMCHSSSGILRHHWMVISHASSPVFCSVSVATVWTVLPSSMHHSRHYLKRLSKPYLFTWLITDTVPIVSSYSFFRVWKSLKHVFMQSAGRRTDQSLHLWNSHWICWFVVQLVVALLLQLTIRRMCCLIFLMMMMILLMERTSSQLSVLNVHFCHSIISSLT